MKEHFSTIRLVDGVAEIQVGDVIFTASRRDSENRRRFCPIDLVVGALGS